VFKNTTNRKSSREKSNENADGKYLEMSRPDTFPLQDSFDVQTTDGSCQDFEPFLRKALNPDITKYRQLGISKIPFAHAI